MRATPGVIWGELKTSSTKRLLLSTTYREAFWRRPRRSLPGQGMAGFRISPETTYDGESTEKHNRKRHLARAGPRRFAEYVIAQKGMTEQVNIPPRTFNVTEEPQIPQTPKLNLLPFRQHTSSPSMSYLSNHHYHPPKLAPVAGVGVGVASLQTLCSSSGSTSI